MCTEVLRYLSDNVLTIMMTDPIADMLTRIRNAQMARLQIVRMPSSKLKMAIANILLQEGYVASVASEEGVPQTLVITLKYVQKQPAIQSIDRQSKPGHRMYRRADELPRVLNNFGNAIVSTSKGVMTDKQARKEGIGGEILCSVY